jgi:heme exporter protein CcmD
MSHNPHFAFVVAAYALAMAVIGGMIAAIAFDYRRLKRELALVESLGQQQRPPDESGPPGGEAQAPVREGLE